MKFIKFEFINYANINTFSYYFIVNSIPGTYSYDSKFYILIV